jgi:hypothetical protein
MKYRAFWIAIVTCLLALPVLAQSAAQSATATAATKPAVPADLPEEYGVYHKTAAGSWEVMHQAHPAKSEMKRGGFTQWTGIGVGGYHSKAFYSGSHANCQISESKPVFYFRLADAVHIQDLEIYQFKEKKDKRELDYGEYSVGRMGSENNGKAMKYYVTIKRLGPELFVVTPESELPAGEYLLGLAGKDFDYDFGIR